MPASVKDRDARAKDLATTFESQGAGTDAGKRLLGAGGGAAGVKLSGRSGRSGLKQDRPGKRLTVVLNGCTFLLFLVHTALKIKSPNGKSYSERLDSVRTEKQLSAIF